MIRSVFRREHQVPNKHEPCAKAATRPLGKQYFLVWITKSLKMKIRLHKTLFLRPFEIVHGLRELKVSFGALNMKFAFITCKTNHGTCIYENPKLNSSVLLGEREEEEGRGGGGEGLFPRFFYFISMKQNKPVKIPQLDNFCFFRFSYHRVSVGSNGWCHYKSLQNSGAIGSGKRSHRNPINHFDSVSGCSISFSR